jgi:hypothetical protein
MVANFGGCQKRGHFSRQSLQREGTRGAAQTVRVSSDAQGGGADSSGQQRGAGAWRALSEPFLTILHVDSFQMSLHKGTM